ncbi:AzlC family ABC transporter permease [Pseudokineococcus basanitobsidens]|uniref:AzlC family ABC transporter permease n=1 Tax=Pseudokineococcus basanitobsidens TaxID=1926649 RepID=A0ABU8RNZ4_9ACTN
MDAERDLSAAGAVPAVDAPSGRPRGVLRDALGVGAATGAYGVSFGALATAAGLSTWQAVALSALMFTGASQFALVGVLGAGGSALGAAATATLLGTRNGLYGLRLASLLRARGPLRLLAAHLTIDESAAMALGRREPRSARWAFWATGASVFVCWNAATVAGALGADALGDPTALGLDAAAPAAFVALLLPLLRGRGDVALALGAAVLALALTPVLPGGLPVLGVGAVALVVGLALPVRRSGRAAGAGEAS